MSRQLNIVYVADIPQTGGASASLRDVVQHMQVEYGARCTVLFPTDGPLKKSLDDSGIRTIITGHRGFLVSRPRSVWKVAPKYAVELALYRANRMQAVRKAEEAIDFSAVDIIHSNLPRNDLGIELAQRHGIPHVCHLREFSFDDFGCWSYRPDPGRYISDGSSALIAVSKACGEAWVRRGVDSSKMRVIYNGIDLDVFAAKRKAAKYSRGSTKVKLLFLGGYNPTKGVMDAIESIALLPKTDQLYVVLDIYGSCSPGAMREMAHKVRTLGLEQIVRLHGACKDVPSILPSYDIGLVCSRSEAFGRVVVEFQAGGLAVVGADTGSIPELLDNGRRGRLYSKEHGAASLASVVADLAENRDELTRLKNEGPSYAAAYDIKRTVADCFTLYMDIIERRST